VAKDGQYSGKKLMINSKKNIKLLVVEDDISLNNQLADLLRNREYQVEQSFDGEEGLLKAISTHFDLILLDVLLPRRDGFSVLKHIRKSKQTPIIMLTACGAEEDRIKGFSKGADDYLPKPFNMEELTLRIDAILRRCGATANRQSSPNELYVAPLRLNQRKQIIYYEDHPFTLTPIQFKLLWVLISHQHEVLTKPYLYQVVLEKEFSQYDRSLDMHLSRVRKKLINLGMAAERLKTVHGTGYSFN
jgi:two-component system response regulator PfeR